MTIVEQSLYQPVPDMDALRDIKAGYQELQVDEDHPLHDEPLVNITDYGIAGQAYYSRNNAATGEPVEGVSENVYVRRTVAEKLHRINSGLQDSVMKKFFDGEVELYVEEGLRSVALQTKLYEQVFPDLIRAQQGDVDDDELERLRSRLIAKPSANSPHAASAFDLTLRYRQESRRYVPGADVQLGQVDGDTSDVVYPDYYEKNPPKNAIELLARTNRRAFYAVMTGEAFGEPTGFVNNPTEWWHWGFGDKLSARIAGQDMAFYSGIDSVHNA